MKIVLNEGYGEYFGKGVAKEYEDFVLQFADKENRTNLELITFVENHPNDCGNLRIITLPDSTTDWAMDVEYGYECLNIYVADGKIHYPSIHELLAGIIRGNNNVVK